MDGWQAIGEGVYVKTYTCAHQTDDQPAGALVRFGGELEDNGYDRDDVCVGSISWCPDCDGPTWQLHSLDPLHVEPSVETTCHKHPPHHGHIRDGRWQPV